MPDRHPMDLRRRASVWRWLASLWLLWIVPEAFPQESSSWRMYKASDGLKDSFVVNVTLSPRGTVWVRHRELESVGWLDGYRIRTLPAPGDRLYPIHESRAGQVWAVHASGLAEYRPNSWTLRPVPEIAEEIRNNPIRTIRPIPLLPLEWDHVLVLLPDRLIEFDASTNRTTTLKTSAALRIGRFTDLIEARDGGAWIVGETGVARLARPLRRLSADSPVEEFPLDPALGIRRPEKPMEDSAGGLTLVGELGGDETRRAVVRLENGRWTPGLTPPDRPRAAWRDRAGRSWVMTRTSLWREEDGGLRRAEQEGVFGGQLFDVALGTNGMFWLATSEGVVQYVPQVWQAPFVQNRPTSLVTAILEDSQGRRWLAGVEGLFLIEEGRAIRFEWPAEVDASLPLGSMLAELPDRRLAIQSPGGPYVFDPVSRRFERPVHPDGRAIKSFVGQARGEGVFAYSFVADAGDRACRIDLYDGRNFRPVFAAGTDWGIGTEVNFVHREAPDEVWVGGSQGLGAWRGGGWVRFGPEHGFTAQRALCFASTGPGRYWCGTGDLLFGFDGQRWSVAKLGFEKVHGLLRTLDGSLWVAAANGMHRFQEGIWIDHGVAEGLPSGAVYALSEDRSGTLWAGTTRGPARHVPQADIDPPRTLLLLRELATEVETEAGISVVFSGQDRWKSTLPHRLLFSYRLDQGPWSGFTPANLLVFPNLSPGSHRLEIRAMDRNWNREVEPASHDFVAVMPWYDEPRLVWLGAVAVVLVAILGGIAVNRHWRLVRSYAEVERIVADRTRQLELANQELLHSQKMKALGTLTAGVAHDFNNILSIVKGSVQVIEANITDPERIRLRLGRIRTVVDQGAGVVRSMLGLTRASRESRQPCDINETVGQVVKVLGEPALHGTQLRFEPAAGLPLVAGVPELIRQILLNLLMNAADAMDRKGTIVIRTLGWKPDASSVALAPSPATGYVAVEVIDQGVGIQPEVLPRIFEPFFTTKAMSSERGTGLGLSMVYAIARELGYGLVVRTTPGVGTTFVLVVPWYLPGTEPGASAVSSTPSSAAQEQQPV